MKYITVKQLKNEEKNKRKKDPSINNHSESLNKVACSKGFKNWDDLINNTVLLQEKKQEINFHEIAQEIQSSLLNVEKILKDGGYKQVSKMIENSFIYLKGRDSSHIFYEYLSRFIDNVAYLYTKKRESENMTTTELFKYVINLFNSQFLIKEIGLLYPILKNEYQFKDLLDNMSTDENNILYIVENYDRGYDKKFKDDDSRLLTTFEQCCYYNMTLSGQCIYTGYCFSILENKKPFNGNVSILKPFNTIDFKITVEELISHVKNEKSLILFQNAQIFNPNDVIDGYIGLKYKQSSWEKDRKKNI